MLYDGVGDLSCVSFCLDGILSGPSSNPPFLSGLDLVVRSRSSVGIHGGAKSGKSPVLSCILRLRPITSGLVLVDGTDVASFDARWLRQQITIVSSPGAPLRGSIRDVRLTAFPISVHDSKVYMWFQVLACGTGASDAAIRRAAERVSLHDHIMSLPEVSWSLHCATRCSYDLPGL